MYASPIHNANQFVQSERNSIRSLRLWIGFKFFLTADLSVDSYTLVIESRTLGLFKRIRYYDLKRVHRLTPYSLGKWSFLVIEADRGEALSAPKPQSREYTSSYLPVRIWLPFLFHCTEAAEFTATVRNAIVRRSLISDRPKY